MLLSSIMSQEEQASWKMFRQFKPAESRPNRIVREEKTLTPISRLGPRAVTSTFHQAKRDEAESSQFKEKATTPGWKKYERQKESSKTPRTPLLSSFTPRLQSDINYEAITPLVTEDQCLGAGDRAANIDILPPKVVFAETQKKPVCYKFATTLKTLKKPPTQQSFERAGGSISQDRKRTTTDRKTSIDSRIDSESKHSRFHTYYGGYPQFILMNESEDETGEVSERKEEAETLVGGKVKKLFENNALRTILKQSGADIYDSQETSTVGRGSVDSQDTGYLANKRFLSSRASPTPGEMMRGVGEAKSPKGRGTHYFNKGRVSERSQMSKTFIGFHFDQSCINPVALPEPTHSHLKALPKKSATPLPRSKQKEDEEITKKKTKLKKKKGSLQREFEFKSPRVYLNTLRKKEDSEEEEEHIEASKLILDFKRSVLLKSQSPGRGASFQDFKVKALNLQKRKVVDTSRGMNIRKRKPLPDLEEKRRKKEFSLLKKHNLSLLSRREESTHDLQKSLEYNDLVQQTKRARELFPYFQKGDKFNELVENKTKETFNHLKRDPILTMTRAQLPGLTPVLRRLRAVSPLALLHEQ